MNWLVEWLHLPSTVSAQMYTVAWLCGADPGRFVELGGKARREMLPSRRVPVYVKPPSGMPLAYQSPIDIEMHFLWQNGMGAPRHASHRTCSALYQNTL